MAKIGIVGSRRRNTVEDAKAVADALLGMYKDGDEIVSGGCPKGADHFAELLKVLCRAFNVPYKKDIIAFTKEGPVTNFFDLIEVSSLRAANNVGKSEKPTT